MNRDTLIEECKEIIKEAYQEATEMIVAYMEVHPNESLRGLCREIDPDNWNALRSRVQRAQQKRRSEGDSGGARAESNRRIDRAAATIKDPDKAAEVIKDPEVRESVRKALDQHYEDSPKPVQPKSRGDEPLELLTTFRRVHKDVDRIIGLIIEGRAVVSDAEREALIEEARWLRTASEHIESGLKAESLEQSLRKFQEEYL